MSRPTIDGTLYGVLATLQVGHGSQLVPVASLIAMWKVGQPDQCVFGLVTPEAAQHEAYREKLATATDGDYVRLYRAV